MGKKTSQTGDSTSWAQQSTILLKEHNRTDPRKQVVADLIRAIQVDLDHQNEIIICGDFNEAINEKVGLHKKLREVGLLNVFQEKIGEELPRTYNGGTVCIDHVYSTPKVYDNITRCGIAPFNYFQESDHRGIYRLWAPLI